MITKNGAPRGSTAAAIGGHEPLPPWRTRRSWARALRRARAAAAPVLVRAVGQERQHSQTDEVVAGLGETLDRVVAWCGMRAPVQPAAERMKTVAATTNNALTPVGCIMPASVCRA